MQQEYRVYMYAFLSRFYSDTLDKKFIQDLQQNSSLLDILGDESCAWLQENTFEEIVEAANIDYTSMYVLNTQPIESFVLDAKSESLVGLQNPVMAFYFQNGFDVKMDQTTIMAPDHLSIELAFMQTLAFRGDELAIAENFLHKHLLAWVLPYMQGMKSMATTPLYRDMCDVTIEFLVSDYEYLLLSREA